MTYTESQALMRDLTFIGRVKVASLIFANYITIEDPTAAGHASRYKWAQQTAQQPDMTAQALTPLVVIDPTVQQAGDTVTDGQLQTAVETIVAKFF